ncbi:cyanophycin synthetase [Bdellovibrio bacteriovorus]
MRVIGLKTLNGPNVYHHHPVIIMRIDLQDWTDVPSDELPELVAGLKRELPGMADHHCSPGVPGGFYERLEKGTYLAHILEHVALEYSILTGMDVTYGKSRYAGRPGLYDIVTRFTNETGMKECLKQSLLTISNLLKNQPVDVGNSVAKIKAAIKRSELGPSAKSLYDAAKKRNIPVTRIGTESLLQLGYGKNSRRVQSAISDRTSLIAADLVQDKNLTKSVLKKAMIPVPHGVVITDESEIHEAMKSLTLPLALKPIDGHHGEGVNLNLQNENEVRLALQQASQYSSTFVLEEMHMGLDYRVLVIDGKFTAAAERLPPFVIGDGTKSIDQLIADLNSDPLRGDGHEAFLTKVVIDEILVQHLAKQGLSLQSVPLPEERITLRANANLSSGGRAKDVTFITSDEIKDMCERVARIVGLDICGIDIIAKDITKSVKESELVVIEVNAGPGLRMHLLQKTPENQDVGSKIIDMLYKDPQQARIPIASVTGTNGKTTVVRLLQKIMMASGKTNVGMTSTEGIWINDKKIFTGDCSGPASAEVLLHDPAIDCAILECARGGLLRGGLAYDWSDVGIITNISADHIGQDGIETIDDLYWIKSLVAERVKKGGTLVINADDENCLRLLENNRVIRHECKIILFSTNPDGEKFTELLDKGYNACWLEGRHIIMSYNGRVRNLCSVEDIPMTISGRAEFQVANVLAALAGAVGLGASPETVLDVLLEFNPTSENQGRMNLYKVGQGYVILDYGHNAEAINNIGKLLQSLPNFKKTVVLGLPGDRSTDLLLQSAEKIAQYYDKVILRDDEDLRGRRPGEVPALLAELYAKKYPGIKVEEILHEEDAVLQALTELRGQEICVIMYEDHQMVMRAMREFDPVPVSVLPFKEKPTYQQPEQAAWQ